ncbi:uncharacterized protein LOC115022283 isoform X2 [Cottoperca gobio]|uniref:Uncharacterized protein LOC115022283 isoform X2 n=1 Tax=Cottoperca gobio TaxID=56716 RepID=A0A6J2RIF9_COTGO|nr:DBIRD complex subunit ZNF326 isoform X2 [Cottoperca gobio]
MLPSVGSNQMMNPSSEPKGAAAAYIQQQAARVPQDFREAMLHIPVKPADNSNRTYDAAAKKKTAQKRAAKPSADKWKCSFQPLVDQDDSPDASNFSSQGAEIYDPYDPVSSDSEHDMRLAQRHNQSPTDQDDNLKRQRLSPSTDCNKKGPWTSSYSESVNLDRHGLNPETRPTVNRGLSPDHRLPERQVYSPNTESLDHPGYDSISRPLDHRVCSPDRLFHGSSTQMFPASYGGQGTNGEERIIIPEYRREMSTTVRLSPPMLQRDYTHQLEYTGTGLDQIPPSTEVPRIRKINMIMDNSPIYCDLCDVELANALKLEDHLESKSHWDTLEHIQQHNNYDDLTIAFLQKVMLHKSNQCSRAIEDSALQALQENDHMTKIEMFHCASCSVFLSTSASSVHTHITSREHLSNTKVQQRRSCLDKADTMIKELKHQFEHFLEGGSPFDD